MLAAVGFISGRFVGLDQKAARDTTATIARRGNTRYEPGSVVVEAGDTR